LPELQIFFQAKAATPPTGPSSQATITPAMLRRVRALSELNDDQLKRFSQFMQVVSVMPWNLVVTQGDCDDGMYLVLDGELRVRLMIDGKETLLAVLEPGDCFGEMSLFDHGPRSADVMADRQSLLLRITSESFDRLLREAPELAAPMLHAISRTLAARVRASNKRIKDRLSLAQAGGY